jgi:hypothetical protein
VVVRYILELEDNVVTTVELVIVGSRLAFALGLVDIWLLVKFEPTNEEVIA